MGSLPQYLNPASIYHPPLKYIIPPQISDPPLEYMMGSVCPGDQIFRGRAAARTGPSYSQNVGCGLGRAIMS